MPNTTPCIKVSCRSVWILRKRKYHFFYCFATQQYKPIRSHPKIQAKKRNIWQFLTIFFCKCLWISTTNWFVLKPITVFHTLVSSCCLTAISWNSIVIIMFKIEYFFFDIHFWMGYKGANSMWCEKWLSVVKMLYIAVLTDIFVSKYAEHNSLYQG